MINYNFLVASYAQNNGGTEILEDNVYFSPVCVTVTYGSLTQAKTVHPPADFPHSFSCLEFIYMEVESEAVFVV